MLPEELQSIERRLLTIDDYNDVGRKTVRQIFTHKYPEAGKTGVGSIDRAEKEEEA